MLVKQCRWAGATVVQGVQVSLQLCFGCHTADDLRRRDMICFGIAKVTGCMLS
jgi:mono/diheme cytochrome c family protein